MKNNEVPFVRGFLNVMAAAAAFVFAGAAPAATVTRVVLNDGGSIALYNPAVAVDTAGNLHIAAVGTDSAVLDKDLNELYYIRVSPSGTILTPLTQVNDADTSAEGRPRIVATSGNKAVIVWRSYSSEAVRAALINPALAPASVVEIGETAVGTVTSNVGHMAAAIDSSDRVHVIVNHGGTNMTHMRFAAADLDSTDVTNGVAEHDIGRGVYQTYRELGLAADPSGNLHIAYQDSSDSAPAYMMLDNDGAVLIDETLLFERDGANPEGSHSSIAADASGVYIVYADRRENIYYQISDGSYQGGTTFFSRIDPSLAAQDGSAGDIDVLRVGSEVRLGGFWYSKSFLGSDGRIHVLAGVGQKGNGDLAYASVSRSGDSPKSTLITASNGGLQFYRHFPVGAGSAAVWAETVYSPTLTGLTMQLVMASVSALEAAASPVVVVRKEDDSFLGCAMRRGGHRAPVDPLLPLLAALSAIYLLRRRVRAIH